MICLHTSPTASLGHSANGGLNVYVRELCLALGRRGVATDIFTRRTGEGPDLEPLGPLGRVVYLPAGPPDADKYRLLDYVPGFSEEVERWITTSHHQYDLLYSHYWLAGMVACCLRSWLGVPWVHTAHTLAVVKNRRLAPGDEPEPEIRVDLEGEISRCADQLVVSTEAEAAELRRAYKVPRDRIFVVTPGCDPQTFKPMDQDLARGLVGQEGRRPFLFVGRLERLKGVEVILRALALVTQAGRHPEARLLVLGEDSRTGGESEKRRLMRLACDLGLEDKVEFPGSVPQSKLPAYYAAAEACLMPSYSESFGLVGLEAQACGTPVVVSREAGLASLIRDGVTGFLVDGPDPEAYAAHMLRLLEEPDLSRRMGARAARLAGELGWERSADRLLGCFDELMGHTGEDGRLEAGG
ncbi:MAG: glycosyltransferase [Candidatus Dormibacteraeota bacterium]|nr:glycosyltransferase [Candidatus Dormibacteraeota bacterium]